MYLIKHASKISGVSVRTLHHYDKIGLLSPQKSKNGYRYYSEEDMSLLQTILFYKYLGFSLQKIKELLLINEEAHLLSTLKKQYGLMQNEKKRLLTLMDTLEKTIVARERRITMSTTDKFKGFTYQDNQEYKQAAMDKYGRDVVEKAIEKQKGKETELTDGFNTIFFAFAEHMSKGLPATNRENVELAKALHEHIQKYAFDCSRDIFASIGYGYVQNPEFKQNLDKFGDGTAQYVCDAIQEYVTSKKDDRQA